MHRIFYCLLPLAAVGAVPAQAQGGAWRVSEVSGDVRIAQGGQSRAATRGALLSGGSVIAGARSRAVLVRGRQYVVVSPGSTVRVDGPAGGAGAIVEVAVEAGNALFKVDRRETPHFRVRTRFLAAVVRGTTFSVTVTPVGGSVQVTEGAVQVSSLDGGASDLIRPGMIARVGASDLYRLTISGDQERVIRSPNAPAASVTAPLPGSPGAGAQNRAQPSVRIASPIGETPVRLRQATNGLVDGAPAINLALRGRGDDAADRNRGSGNDRDSEDGRGAGRDDREDRASDLERDGRGNGNGGGRGDDDGEGKDKDKPDGGGGGDKPGKDDDEGGKPGKDDGDDADGGGKPGKDDGDDADDGGKPGKDDGDDADDGGKPGKNDGDDADDGGKPGKDDGDDADDGGKPGKDDGGDEDDGGKPDKDDGRDEDDGDDDDGRDEDDDDEDDDGDDDDGDDGDDDDD